jgi:DNA-binding response OmpR family regulator
LRLEVLATAEEGLRLARTASVDLWVINTHLHGIGGSELCDMLKARDPRTTVYLVADEYTPEIELMARRSRATLFGCKPAQRDWLASWQAEHQRRAMVGHSV